METAIKIKGNKVKLIAVKGFTNPGKALIKVTDTGMGFICKFPSWDSIVDQDYYVCLDYAQASYLLEVLTHFEEAVPVEVIRTHDDLSAY